MVEKPCALPDGMTFGEALAELEQIVRTLEGGRLELEESLTQYQRGVGLLRGLRETLEDAQQKVTVLLGEFEESGESGTGESIA